MPQYDPTLYSGYWLKSYEQGTTTPLNMATDATGGTTLAKSELDAQGFPTTAGSARFIPFIDGDYDLWLFSTEALADANDTSSAIQLADNLNADPDTAGQLSLWDTNITYDIPEIVLGSDDEYYRSLIDSNSGNDPTSSAVQWELLSFGRIWNTNITYGIGDSAYGSDGHLYIARVSQSGNDPTSDTTNWDESIVFSDVLDEDDMASDSDTKLSTQQAIKAYTDGKGVKQIITAVDIVVQTTTSTIPVDDTVPAITEGLSLVDVTITPIYSDSKLVFFFECFAQNSSGEQITLILIDVTGTSTLKATAVHSSAQEVQMIMHHVESSPGTSANTYRIRIGRESAGTVTINGTGGSRLYGGVAGARLTVMEIR